MVGVLMTKLKDVFSLQITGEWGIEYTENETNTKVLRTTNFTPDGIINYSDVVLRCIHKDKVEKKKLRYGDIILEKSGGTEKTPVGRVVFCDESIEKDTYLCNNFTQAMRVNREIAVPKYVFYFMWNLHNSGKTELLQNKTTGIRNLQVKSYLNEEIPLPPLDEQRKIAAVLDKVSDLIAKRRQQLTKLDELVKARFMEMFGKLEFNNNATTIEEISEMVTVGIANSATHAYAAEGIVLLRNQNIRENYLDDSDLVYITPAFADKYRTKALKENDILVTRTGYPGIACLVPKKYIGCQTFTTLILRLKESIAILPSFVCHYINSNYGKSFVEEMKVGVAQQNFGAKALGKMPIFVPPIEKQVEFVTFIDEIEKIKVSTSHSLDKLETLKNALMQEYFG